MCEILDISNIQIAALNHWRWKHTLLSKFSKPRTDMCEILDISNIEIAASYY
jgi:hypothetical protein